MTAALKIGTNEYQRSSTAHNVIPLREVDANPAEPQARPSSSSSRSTALRSVPKPASGTVQPLPQSPTLPLWLQILIYTQKGSSVLMISSVAVMLSVYGWTVHIQDSWGQEYHKLQTLLRQERQLTTSNEALRQTIAETAEDPSTQMALPAPSQMLFLKPASAREPLAVETQAPVERPKNAPIGY